MLNYSALPIRFIMRFYLTSQTCVLFWLNHQLYLSFILEVFRSNLDHEFSRDFLQSHRNEWRDATLKYATADSSKIHSN